MKHQEGTDVAFLGACADEVVEYKNLGELKEKLKKAKSL